MPPSPRILDAGCGTGRNLLEFGKLGQATGVDVSAQAVEFCRGRGVEDVRQAAVEDLPFEALSFDVLLATDVIEHVDDDTAVLRELRRVAAREARLILTVPAYQWLWSSHDESVHHRRRYTARRLRERVLAAGWAPTVETYFFSTVLPRSRWCEPFGTGPGRTASPTSPSRLPPSTGCSSSPCAARPG